MLSVSINFNKSKSKEADTAVVVVPAKQTTNLLVDTAVQTTKPVDTTLVLVAAMRGGYIDKTLVSFTLAVKKITKISLMVRN